MVECSNEEGSGGYQRPCWAAARFTSTFRQPGSATAIFATGSTTRVRILSRESTTPPATAVAPPDRPEPAPRGTTATPLVVAHRRVCWTCPVLAALTTASGQPAPGSRAAS